MAAIAIAACRSSFRKDASIVTFGNGAVVTAGLEIVPTVIMADSLCVKLTYCHYNV